MGRSWGLGTEAGIDQEAATFWGAGAAASWVKGAFGSDASSVALDEAMCRIPRPATTSKNATAR